MTWGAKKYATTYVALRKESVDRNRARGHEAYSADMSLSARRAWIEIQMAVYKQCITGGRSPQGERG